MSPEANNAASPVVLIFGEESFLVDRELAQIEKGCGLSGAEDMNRQVFDASDTEPSAVISASNSMPVSLSANALLAAWTNGVSPRMLRMAIRTPGATSNRRRSRFTAPIWIG